MQGFSKPTLKTQSAQMTNMIKIMRGDTVVPIKRRKPVVRKAKNDMAEKRLEGQIILRLKMMGCEVAKSGEQAVYNSRYVLAGMADLLVFIPKYGVLFLEIKTPKGKQRDSQKRFEDLCNGCGLKYALVRSVKEARDVVKQYLK